MIQSTEQYINILKDKFQYITIKDNSYGNDLTDSIMFGDDDFSLYLPNSLENDDENELFNTFVFGSYPENKFFDTNIQYENINQVINKIKDYYNNN